MLLTSAAIIKRVAFGGHVSSSRPILLSVLSTRFVFVSTGVLLWERK